MTSEIDVYLADGATKDLHNCCGPGRVWWPGMGWPDIRGLNEANRSREQQLLIGELFREEISPSRPSFSSGE